MTLQTPTLSEADLTWADLRGVKYDRTTRFPDRFDPEGTDMVLVE